MKLWRASSAISPGKPGSQNGSGVPALKGGLAAHLGEGSSAHQAGDPQQGSLSHPCREAPGEHKGRQQCLPLQNGSRTWENEPAVQARSLASRDN